MRNIKHNSLIILTFFIFAFSANAQHKTVEEVEGKAVGETVENFIATDADGNTFNLKTSLKEGPVVLLFYRGQWCPVCNHHLSQLQENLDLIKNKGAKVIAVSPEKQENLQKTKSQTGAEFTLLYDKNYKISEDFDVAFVPKEQLIELYDTRLDADLENAHSDNSKRIPVPATFIIDQDGRVAWRHFDRDYKKRASAEEIMKALDKI
ncbi:peroxiredoxin-like family protein [Marivirga salinae]|uniref:thioredoxin-dependent peroxiredoxin n=1 Tax=Marivirga salinarum TaxID=3059078 RepID=A0AA51NEM0_9BACT|nr:peroxiredoxin-like family protein [Marivirga sp. BDSF4-3]WMN12971.1 peroxiredoxin-like family protein [Marivirga sp. BDSF4-3]